jgi:N-acetylmuramoyl-L-alanine amidase
MAYTITNNKLDGVQQVVTTNMGGALSPKNRRFLVLHYTAGPSLEGTIETFKSQARQVSAHLVIGRDGKIAQVVPFDRVAWHAGPSTWKPAKGGTVKSLNFFSIGIEMVNAGPLSLVGGQYLTWWGGKINPSEVVEVDPSLPTSFGKRYWHHFPEEQVLALLEVARLLVDTYKLEEIIGHSDICPGRKTDPGPAFPINNVRSAIYGRA